MFCPGCGQETDQKENFCSSCGYNFREGNPAHSQVNASHEPEKSGLVYKILGWIFAVISLLFIPVLFGAGAFIMGYLLKKSGSHNETHGTIIMVMGVACGILGMLLGLAAAGY